MLPCPILPARPQDTPGVCDLLERCDLPTRGVGDHVETTVVARLGERVVGCAVAELLPDGAVIRCVAVDPHLRGTGVGHALTLFAIAVAARGGAPSVYLTTTSAVRFFARLGFSRARGEDLPEGVRASVEADGAAVHRVTIMARPIDREADDHPCPPGYPAPTDSGELSAVTGGPRAPAG